jgi:uncharacterized RDD family membrane protein YckC
MEATEQMQKVEYVGFWRRVLASMIDTILITAVTFPIMIRIYGLRHVGLSDFSLVRGPIDFLVSYVLPAILIIGFWHFKLATPGKMVISAVIVDARSYGKPSTSQLVARYAGYFLSTIFLFVGFMWIGIDRRKQGWHDKIARTVVISTRTPRK